MWLVGSLAILTLVEGDVMATAAKTDLTKILPGMAEKWTISDDGVVYTFTIRANVPPTSLSAMLSRTAFTA